MTFRYIHYIYTEKKCLPQNILYITRKSNLYLNESHPASYAYFEKSSFTNVVTCNEMFEGFLGGTNIASFFFIKEFDDLDNFYFFRQKKGEFDDQDN